MESSSELLVCFCHLRQRFLWNMCGVTVLAFVKCFGSVSFTWVCRHKPDWPRMRLYKVGASHLHAVNFPNWYVERSSSACRKKDRLLTEISYIPQWMQGQETTRLEIPLRSTESHQNHSWEESAYTKRRRDARDWQHVLYEDLKQRSFSLARLTRAHSFNCNLSSNCWTCVWLCFTDKIAALFARTTQH